MPEAKTSFVLCIDVEPRGREDVIGDVEEWAGLFTCMDYLTEWRKRYQAQTGLEARFCWLLRFDEQMEAVYGSRDWTVDRFREPLQELTDAGDVLGVHHHMYRRDRAGRWREDYTDPSFVQDSIFTSRDAFVSALGYQPECLSIGAGWLDQTAVRAIDEAGFKYDMTLTPARPARPANPPGLGSYPDYLAAPRLPYRPSRGDFLRPGRGSDKRDLWLLPVSTSCGMHPGKWHPGYDQTHRMDQLNVSIDDSYVQTQVDGQLAANDPFILCLLRTGDVSIPKHDTLLRANGEYLLNHPRLTDIAFETPAEAIMRYTSRSKERRQKTTSAGRGPSALSAW